MSSSSKPAGTPVTAACRPARIERSGRCDWPAGPLLLLLLLVAAAGLPEPAAAQEPNRAGLVIQFDEGRVETWCLEFEGTEIAGNDLLARSGQDLVIDATSGLGITVCQIEGQGCAFPAQHCFCQCMGGEGCRYWNYFYREPRAEAWTYSPLGALLRQVQPGGVEAWVWGDGSTPPDEALTFEAICAPPTPTALPPTETPAEAPPSPTAAATALAADPATAVTPAPSPTPSPEATSIPAPATATNPATATAQPPAGEPANAGNYLVFGLLLLGLAVIGAVAWLRRR
ncbi:MAG: hypothetical protein ACK2UY_08835 [Anaerolineae bacterium]